MSKLYEIEVKKTNQSSVSLTTYQGKVLLIVNTASGCGFTPQYEGLEVLYKTYKDKGLEILDFPCNQFGNQAPGSDADLAQFCALKYNTSFETFAKLDVNGKKAHPLFTYLKNNAPKEGLLGAVMPKVIKWNFTKFLVDREGKIIHRYEPTTPPEAIAQDIETLL